MFELGIFFRSSQVVGAARQVEQAWGRTGKVLDGVTSAATRSGKAVDAYGNSAQRADKSTRDSLSTFGRSSRVVGGYSTQMENLTRRTNDQAAATSRLSGGLGGMVRQLVGVAAALLTVHAGLGQISSSIDVFREFELRTAGVQAVSSATADEMVRLETQTRSLGETTIFTARQAAEAQEALARAGFAVSENLDTLPRVLQLASAGELSLASAADIAAGTLRGFHIAAADSQRPVDILAKSAAIANTTVQEMGEGMKFAAPTAQGLGISLEDTAAAMTILSDNMLKGSLGGTGFRQALLGIIDPSGKADTVLTDLGISAEKFRSVLTERGLVEALRLLVSESTDITQAIQIAGSRGGSALQILISNIDKLAEKRGQLGDVAGEAERMAKVKLDTLSGDTDVLNSAIESLRLTFGEALAPTLRLVQKELTAFFQDGHQGAAAFGENVATVIKSVAEVFLFAASHADLLKVALLTLLAVSLASWISSLVSGLVAATGQMLGYTAAVNANTAALVTNRTVTSSVPLVYGAQGQALSVLTTQTTATTTATTGLAGAQTAATASSGRFMALGLTPLTVVLAAVLAAVLLVNNAITDWGDRMQREMDAAVSSTAAFSDSMEMIRQKTAEVVSGGDLQALSELLDQQRNRQEELTATRDAAGAAMQKHARNLKLATEQGNAHGQWLENNTRLQQEATDASSMAKRELQVLTGTTGALVTGLREYKPAVEAAAAGTGGLAGKLREQHESLKVTLKSLGLETQALDRLSIAALKGEESFGEAQRAAELEKRFRAEAAKLTGVHADKLQELRGAIGSVIDAEKKLAGSKVIAGLRDQVKGYAQLAAAYDVGTQAAAAVQAELDLEADLRANTADATAEQRAELEELTKTLRDLQVSTAAKEDAAALRDEIDVLGKMSKAFRGGARDVEDLTDALQLQADVQRLTTPLMAEQVRLIGELSAKRAELGAVSVGSGAADALQEEIGLILQSLALNETQQEQLRGLAAQRAESVQVEGQEEYLSGLRENVAHLTAEDEILREAAAAQGFFGDAARAGALELAVFNRVLEAGVDPAGAMADEIRRLTEEEFRLADSIDHTREYGDAWVDAGKVISDVLGQLDSDLGSLAGGIFDAVGGLKNLQVARARGGGGTFSAESRAFGGQVAGVIGTAADATGFSGGGTSVFGGAMEGNLVKEGAQIGGQVGGAWGAAIGAFVGAMMDTGADDLHSASIEAAGKGKLVISQAEGGLADIAGSIAQTFDSFVNGLQESMTADLDMSGIEVHIRENRVRVVTGETQRFFDNIEDAMAFAVQGVLAASKDADGLGANMKALFERVSGPDVVGSLEDLQKGLNLAQALDFRETGVTGVLIRKREEAIRIGKMYGLSMDDIMDMQNEAIAETKRGLVNAAAGALGVTDVAGFYKDLAAGFNSFDKEVSAEEAARRDRMVAIEEEKVVWQELIDVLRDAGAAGTAAGGSFDNGPPGGTNDDPRDTDDVSGGGGFGGGAGGGGGIAGGGGGVGGSATSGDGTIGDAPIGSISYSYAPKSSDPIADPAKGIAQGVVLGAVIVGEGSRKGMGIIGQDAIDGFGELGEDFGTASSAFTENAMAAAEASPTSTRGPGANPPGGVGLAPPPTPPTLTGPPSGDGTPKDTGANAARDLQLAQRGLEDVGKEAVALADSLEGLPEQFGLGEIGKLWTAGAAKVGLSLIDMLQAIEGPSSHAAEQAQLQKTLFILQLAAQIEQARTLFAMMEGVSQATRNMFAGLINDSQTLLEGLTSGDVGFNLGGAGGGGGGGGGRQDARAGIREQFRQLDLDARLTLDGVRSLTSGLADFRDTMAEARKLGKFSADELRNAWEDFITVAARAADEGVRQQLDAFRGISDFDSQLRDNAQAFDDARGQYDLLIAAAIANGQSTADLVARREELTLAEADAAKEMLTGGLIDALGAIGLELDPETVWAMQKAEFELAKIRAVSVLTAAAQAGVLDDLGLGFQDWLLRIAETSFPDFVAPEDLKDPVAESRFANMAELMATFATGTEAEIASVIENFTLLREDAVLLGATFNELGIIHQEEIAALTLIAETARDTVQAELDAARGQGSFAATLAGTTARFSAAESSIRKVIDALRAAGSDVSGLELDLLKMGQAAKLSSQSLGRDFLGSLDQLGVSLPTEVTREMATASLMLAKAEAISSALALYAAGAFDDLSFTIGDLIGLINEAGTAGAEGITARRAGGSRSSGSGGGSDPLDGLRQKVEDQLRAWNRLPLGDVTMQAVNLAETLVQVRSDAAAAGVALDKVDAAFKVAVDTFVADALDPFLNLNLSPLQRELDGILDQFVDMLVAFEVAGASAEQMAQLQEAFQASMQDFLDRSTQGIRDFLDELRETDPRVSGQEAFETSQADFRDLLAAAQGGDLDALSQLEAAARSFKENAVGFLGGGVGLQEVLDELMGGLDSVADFELVPADIALLQEQADALLALIDIADAQPTAVSQNAGFSGVSSSFATDAGLIADAVGAIDVDLFTPEDLQALVDGLGVAGLTDLVAAMGALPLSELVTALGAQTIIDLTAAMTAATLSDLTLALGSSGVIELATALGVSDMALLANALGAGEMAGLTDALGAGIVAEIGAQSIVDLDAALGTLDLTGMDFSEIVSALNLIDPTGQLATVATALGSEGTGILGGVKDLKGPADTTATATGAGATEGGRAADALTAETGAMLNKLSAIRLYTNQTQAGITGSDPVKNRLGRMETIWRDIAAQLDVPGYLKGGQTTEDGLAFLHAGERVLNPSQTLAFQALGGLPGLSEASASARQAVPRRGTRAAPPPPPPARRPPVVLPPTAQPPAPPPPARRGTSLPPAPSAAPEVLTETGRGTRRRSQQPGGAAPQSDARGDVGTAQIVEALEELDNDRVVDGLENVRAAVARGNKATREQARENMRVRAAMAASAADTAAAANDLVQEVEDLRSDLAQEKNRAPVGEAR